MDFFNYVNNFDRPSKGTNVWRNMHLCNKWVKDTLRLFTTLKRFNKDFADPIHSLGFHH